MARQGQQGPAGSTRRRGSRQRPPLPPGPKRRLIDYPRRARTGLRRWIPSFKLAVGLAFSLVLLAIGGFAAAIAVTPVPEPNDIARAQMTIVYWNDGKTELGRLGEANRISVPLSGVPANLQHAVLAAEDRGFYDHGGFDPGAIMRAGWNNLTGRSTQGGSTITQQYAKNAFLSQEKSYTRKLKELVLSVKLETQVSKDKILENYLNTIYLGRGSYGVETASHAYFGRPVSRLSLGQSAAIAAIIRAPGGYDPERNRDKLKERWNYVLDGMAEKGWITPAQRAKAQFPEFKKYKMLPNSFAGTDGYLLDYVRTDMLRHGYTEDDINLDGFRITTTFDKDDQQAAIDAVESEGPSYYTDGLHIGVASVEPGTGAVRALYGGEDYLKNQLSDANQAIALAGSTFKPFALAAAVEKGISLDSYWNGNSPQTINGYTLQNEFNQSYGQVSLLYAIEESINTPFVWLGNEVGFNKVKQAAIRAGIPADTYGLTADPTTVLGTSSPTALDMASAYATFAAHGMRAQPTAIGKITRNGSDAVEYQLDPKPVRAFSANVADTVTWALEHVVTSGTGTTALGLGRPAAGKTGTADGGGSAWFIGFTPQLSTAVMLMKTDKKGNLISLDGTGGYSTVFGASFPAQIWTAYMSDALDGTETEYFTDPYGGGTTDYYYGNSDSYGYDSYESESSSPSSTPSSSGSVSGGASTSPSAGSSAGASVAPSAGGSSGSGRARPPGSP